MLITTQKTRGTRSPISGYTVKHTITRVPRMHTIF